MLLHVHPGVDDTELQVGRLVAVNDQMLVVATLPEPRTGEAVTLEERLDDARVLVTTGGGSARILTLSSALGRIAGTGEGLKPGDTLAADLRADVATALIERTSVEQVLDARHLEYGVVSSEETLIDSIAELLQRERAAVARGRR